MDRVAEPRPIPAGPLHVEHGQHRESLDAVPDIPPIGAEGPDRARCDRASRPRPAAGPSRPGFPAPGPGPGTGRRNRRGRGAAAISNPGRRRAAATSPRIGTNGRGATWAPRLMRASCGPGPRARLGRGFRVAGRLERARTPGRTGMRPGRTSIRSHRGGSARPPGPGRGPVGPDRDVRSPTAVPPTTRGCARVHPQEQRREVDDQRPGPMARFEGAAEQEVRRSAAVPQHGQVVSRPTEAGLEHARQDTQLDQAIAETEDLGPRGVVRRTAERRPPRGAEPRMGGDVPRMPGDPPIRQGDQPDGTDQAGRPAARPRRARRSTVPDTRNAVANVLPSIHGDCTHDGSPRRRSRARGSSVRGRKGPEGFRRVLSEHRPSARGRARRAPYPDHARYARKGPADRSAGPFDIGFGPAIAGISRNRRR